MKLSKSTIDILRNFASINTGVHFSKGKVIRTAHPQKVIVGRAVLEDDIPQDFVIYNLNEFLGVISLRNDADFIFQKDKVIIKDGEVKINYNFADPSMVVTCPEPSEMPTPDVKFKLTQAQLDDIKKSAGVLGLEDLKVESDGKNVSLVIYDAKDPTANSYALDIPSVEHNSKSFSFVFKIANLQLLSSSYEVAIKHQFAGHFKSESTPVQYWVPLEKNSKLSA